MSIDRGDTHRSIHLAGDLAKSGQVIAMVMGDDDRLDILVADGVEKFFRLPWSVDQDAFVGLRTGDEVAVVAHGAHPGNFGDLYFAVIVQCHIASPQLIFQMVYLVSDFSRACRLLSRA